MMQTVQEYDREDRGPGHAPRRTNTMFVSETFSFLDEEKYDEENPKHVGGHRGLPSSRSEPVLLRCGGAGRQEAALPNGNVQGKNEFTIVTSVEQNNPVKMDKGVAPVIENGPVSGPTDLGVDEYTIVTYADKPDEKEKDPPPPKGVKLPFPFNSVYIVDEGTGSENKETDKDNKTNGSDTQEMADNTSADSNGIKSEDGESERTERNSVIIEGEVVELRTSPREGGPRKSRQPTWKKNQALVSEAFCFLKDIDGIEGIEDIGIEDADPVQYENDVNIAENSENKDSSTDNMQTADTLNGSLNTPGVNEGSETPADNDVQVLDRSAADAERQEPQSGIKGAHSVTNGNSSESITGESDDVGELVGGKLRQRRKPKQKSSSNSENADDDGDSSDDDKGVYRESFRKSTWLYVGDNETLRTEKPDPQDYVPLADLGVDTCERDSVFGDGPPLTPKTPLSGHRRNDSTATTASEADFKRKFNSVSKRYVQRADSQQEYKRFTAQCYDQVKAYFIEKEEDQDYGIHLLDSKPAIVSGVDAESPAELAGVKEGQVVTVINGQNVVELDHDAIIALVQQNTRELRLEVGSGDVSHIIDLQRPVVTGFLQKQTSATIFRSWKRRFFILRRDNCLYYYKNNQDSDPLGAIPLSGYRVSRHGDPGKFSFKAEKYGCRTYYFQAENRDDMTRWVGALNEAAERGNEKKDAWMDVTTHNVGLPALEIRKPDCSGYLSKQGRNNKGWRKRYCVLKDACIYYYKNSNAKQAEGVAHLHGYTVDCKGPPGKRYSWALQPPEKQMRVFSFYTDNDTDKDRWVNALNTSIGKWVRVEP